MKFDFLFVNAGLSVYKKLLNFSGWLGVNNVISAISGRLDVTMLAALSTASVTGIYSLASRFALFIVVLTGSFSAVLATRFASFDDKAKEKNYLIKSTLGLIPIALATSDVKNKPNTAEPEFPAKIYKVSRKVPDKSAVLILFIISSNLFYCFNLEFVIQNLELFNIFLILKPSPNLNIFLTNAFK
jgi:hypothetical protein